MTLVILPSARGDLAAGSDFYEQREQGAGARFLDSLISDIDSLKPNELMAVFASMVSKIRKSGA